MTYFLVLGALGGVLFKQTYICKYKIKLHKFLKNTLNTLHETLKKITKTNFPIHLIRQLLQTTLTTTSNQWPINNLHKMK